MSQPSTTVVEHHTIVAATAEAVFDLVADVELWPQYFTPIVHVEREQENDSSDTVRIWALRGRDAVRHWTSRRDLDRTNLRINFTNEPPEAPLTTSGGEWIFAPQPDGSCNVTLRHHFSGPDDPAIIARVRGELDRHLPGQLEELKTVAERVKELEQLVTSFEDPLFVAGSAEDAYQILYEADLWPERIPHVYRIELTEKTPNIQFFDMETATPDGRTHTTRSVRVCLPHHKIVYKQIGLPPYLEAHTGHWLFTEVPDGIIASARHTVTIKSAALALLGPEATVRDARIQARRMLSANSMKNLQIAKAYAESRAHG